MEYKSKFKAAEIDARLEKMVNVTYAELVALRDEGKLIAGQMYRMTDYETTCTWENTQVAGHPFDLVLTALDNKTLDEKCSAILSERDTDGYFANSNLAAWDVRYCLDNDINRFDWALQGGTVFNALFNGVEFTCEYSGQEHEIDGVIYHIWYGRVNGEPAGIVLTLTLSPKVGDTVYGSNTGSSIDVQMEVVRVIEQESGKGVIYSLTDERSNTCSYDFKNIKHSYNDEFVYTFHLDGADGSLTDEAKHNKFVECKNTFVIGSCWRCNIYNSTNIHILGFASDLKISFVQEAILSECENVQIGPYSNNLNLTNIVSSRFDDNCGNITLKISSSLWVMNNVRNWTSSRINNSIVLRDGQNTIVKDLANL